MENSILKYKIIIFFKFLQIFEKRKINVLRIFMNEMLILINF